MQAQCLFQWTRPGREALWQIQGILNTCQRRWPQLAERATPGDAAVADWCDWVAGAL
ncbi:MAG: hypothetical protein QM569_03330 [Acidovorax sp.]|uniref:hypothetical protein n=1 Tax=Acidovorax sp. TaxID=1872122 RepID=UPI0039E367ED